MKGHNIELKTSIVIMASYTRHPFPLKTFRLGNGTFSFANKKMEMGHYWDRSLT